MKTFVKKSHIPFQSLIWLLTSIFCSLILALGYISKEDIFQAILLVMCLIIFAIILNRHMHTWGLYVNADDIYFKLFKSYKVNVLEIAAIKIVPSITPNGTGSFQPIKDRDGVVLYSMVFLNHVIEGMDSHNTGDFHFCYAYKDSVMFYVIYDQSVIDYLLTLNPNIIVF